MQEDKRTGEIPNIAYTIVLDELWYFTCPSCPQGREIASDHLKSSVKKILGNRGILYVDICVRCVRMRSQGYLFFGIL